MSRATSAASRANVQRPSQFVYVNGTLRHDIECYGILLGYGMKPSTADLFMPAKRAGDDVDELQDAEVVIYARGTIDPMSSDPVFRGFVAPEKHSEGGNASRISLRAFSPISILDRIFVGQKQNLGYVSYPKTDPVTGAATGWTISGILQDIFSAAKYDSNFDSKICLGSVFGAVAAERYVLMPDITFPATSYRDAIRRLLALAPDVGVRERFANSTTFLDFYIIGRVDVWRDIIIPDATGPESGAWATAHVREEDMERIYSRVIGYGAPRKTQVTVCVVDPPPAIGQICDAYLEPAWPLATPYASHPAYTVDEQCVLDNPALATVGDPEFARDATGDCFRKFKLPAQLRGYDYSQEGVAVDTNGKRIQFQVFRTKYNLTATPGGGLTGAASTTEFEMIRGATFDAETGILELPSPALAISAVTYVSAEEPPKTILVPVNVFITLTIVETAGGRLRYDTGIRGDVRIPTILNTGLVFTFINEKNRYEQVGSDVIQFGGATFGSIHYDETQVTAQWLMRAYADPLLMVNDSRYLAQMCESCLAERMRRRVTASARLPFATTAFVVGDGVFIKNRGIDNRLLQIVNVKIDYADNSTAIVATDQVPYLTEAAWDRRLDKRNVGKAVDQDIANVQFMEAQNARDAQSEPFGRAYPTTPEGKKDWAERMVAQEIEQGRKKVKRDDLERDVQGVFDFAEQRRKLHGG